LKVCSLTGVGFSHSRVEGFLLKNNWFREFLMASHMIHMKKITARNEIKDPREETIFHEVKASG
jgi:hypothetical protein